VHAYTYLWLKPGRRLTARDVAMASPRTLSVRSLAGWADNALGLPAPWTYAVPVSAAACAGVRGEADEEEALLGGLEEPP
jgi:hypothetical protein